MALLQRLKDLRRAKAFREGYSWAAYEVITGSLAEEQVAAHIHGSSDQFDIGAKQFLIDYRNKLQTTKEGSNHVPRD